MPIVDPLTMVRLDGNSDTTSRMDPGGMGVYTPRRAWE